MIVRRQQPEIVTALNEVPAVVLIGPRQIGKTTLARAIAEERESVYLDLERPADRAKLADPESYLTPLEDSLVVLDEVQRTPEIFPTLRVLIDAGRRRGRRAGRFLVLGSASLELLRQSSESLAGRVRQIELMPFLPDEVDSKQHERLWVRGGFPESFLARNDDLSLEWRNDFLRTYLERDVAQFHPRMAAETLRRLWTMLAHLQGSILNQARIAAALGVSSPAVGRYVDLLVDLLMVRRLEPWTRNVGKRLVKSPKVYVRDSGVLHALLGIRDRNALAGHPVAAASFEGHVIETSIAHAARGTIASFYRTARGAEIDLVLEPPGGRCIAIEIKNSLAPRLERGFHEACADLEPAHRYCVYRGDECFIGPDGVEFLGHLELAARLQARHRE